MRKYKQRDLKQVLNKYSSMSAASSKDKEHDNTSYLVS